MEHCNPHPGELSLKGHRGHWLALSCLLGALLAFPGAVEAAPQVLPVSSATVFVNGTVDYIDVLWNQGSSQNVGGSGSAVLYRAFTLTAPDGQTTSLTPIISPSPGFQEPFHFRWLLNGTNTITPSGGPNTALSEDLSGAAGDGTWMFQDDTPTSATSFTLVVELSVGGRYIQFAMTQTCPGSIPTQYWNQHVATWQEPTYPTCAIGTLDPVNENAAEDPNNARFFQDSPDSPFTAYTLGYSAPVCANTIQNSTVNGAWLGASGTIFSEFIYRDGNFLGTTDLRTVIGYANTTEENEGAAASGTDSKSIPYNNAAGTSYQFRVRNSTTEALGSVQWIPSGACQNVAFPTGADVEFDPHALHVTASQAQCKDDAITFSIVMQDNPTGLQEHLLELFIFDANQGGLNTPPDPVEVAYYNTSTMHRTALATEAHAHFVADVLPPGNYVAFAFANYTGIGAQDYIDAEAFNVPRGSCDDALTDLSPVLTAIASSTAFLNNSINTQAESIRALMLAYWTAYNATEAANLATILASLNITQASLVEFWADHNATALSDLTTILAAIAAHDANMSEQHALQNVTLENIYQVVQDLNLTIECQGNNSCNFFIDNATLQAIYENLTDHRNHTLELTFMNDFNGLGFDGFLFLLFWIAALLFFSYQSWWFALGFSLPGLLEVMFPTQIPEDFMVYFTFCLLGVVMEIAAHRFSWGSHKEKGVRPS